MLNFSCVAKEAISSYFVKNHKRGENETVGAEFKVQTMQVRGDKNSREFCLQRSAKLLRTV